MSRVKRALISVSDKQGIVEFGKRLAKLDIEILSTGGTAKILRDAGVDVKDVSEHTGFPECLDGRVKTLHPKVHGGILGRRDLDSHIAKMQELGIEQIDLVVVNLYPFEATIAKENVELAEAIENIDIGGPAMIRSAAKNYAGVAVVVEPADYETVAGQIESTGEVSLDTRQKLSAKAFGHTAWYDGRISSHLAKEAGTATKFPDRKIVQLEKEQDLRYGENPHQSAAFYKEIGGESPGMGDVTQLNGKELSFNNIVDMSAAYELVCEFDECACAVIKHTNPCGTARGESQLDVFTAARDVDPVSAFGGVIAFNRSVQKDTAEELAKLFLEIVIAPAFDEPALEILKTKKNLRLLELPLLAPSTSLTTKFVRGSALLQDEDNITLDESTLKCVTKREPTQSERKALLFAWTVAKHVKSNAIIYADENCTIGVGAGQMSRVDSSKIAVLKAHRSIEGSVMASDAFFPFRDSIDEAAKAGIKAIIQPGGSIRDEEVIASANEHGMAMLFTGIRHFRH